MEHTSNESRFPDWSKLYSEEAVETMPWFHAELDPDLASAIEKRGFSSGKFLDIGTGPGTQAIKLAQLGFQVSGTDLSSSAIEKAKLRSDGVRFFQDDILNSHIQEKFDFAFDRGCFHCLAPESRSVYIATLHKILNPQGILFLKTFSMLEDDWETGPWRFSPNDIQNLFGKFFTLEESIETLFQGTMEKKPKALFSVLRKI